MVGRERGLVSGGGEGRQLEEERDRKWRRKGLVSGGGGVCNCRRRGLVSGEGEDW